MSARTTRALLCPGAWVRAELVDNANLIAVPMLPDVPEKGGDALEDDWEVWGAQAEARKSSLLYHK